MNLRKLFKGKKVLIMGILNVTPDSFSDGGQFNSIKNAVKRAKQMEKEGADLIDIGGESTGPGSKKVSIQNELERTIPIVKAISKEVKVPISIDTYKSKIAEEALKNGASIVNDVTALRGDKKMASIIKQYKNPVILMYSKDKTARTTIKEKEYKNVTATVKNFLTKRIKHCLDNGIRKSQIIIDPGMGHFISSKAKYSFEIISKLEELISLKAPVLIGASRKSFLGGRMEERDEKGKTITAIAYLKGVSIIRTHDVKGTKQIIDSL